MQRRMNPGWKMRCRVTLQESEEGFSEEALANIADAVREYLEVERQQSVG